MDALISYLISACKSTFARRLLGCCICLAIGFTAARFLDETRMANAESEIRNKAAAFEAKEAWWEKDRQELNREIDRGKVELSVLGQKYEDLKKLIDTPVTNASAELSTLRLRLDEQVEINADLARKLAIANRDIENFSTLKALQERIPSTITNYAALTIAYAYKEKCEILREIVSSKISKLDTVGSQFVNLATKIMLYRSKEIESYKKDSQKYNAEEARCLQEYILFICEIGQIKEHFVTHIILTANIVLQDSMLEDVDHFRTRLKVPFSCEKNLDALFSKAVAVDINDPAAFTVITEILENHIKCCDKQNAVTSSATGL